MRATAMAEALHEGMRSAGWRFKDHAAGEQQRCVMKECCRCRIWILLASLCALLLGAPRPVLLVNAVPGQLHAEHGPPCQACSEEATQHYQALREAAPGTGMPGKN